MTHVCQKLAFGFAGVFCLLFGHDHVGIDMKKFGRSPRNFLFKMFPVRAKLGVSFFDLAEHFVESVNEGPDFIIAGLRRANREVLFGRYELRSGRECLKWF